jgi:hypothetical protein
MCHFTVIHSRETVTLRLIIAQQAIVDTASTWQETVRFESYRKIFKGQ